MIFKLNFNQVCLNHGELFRIRDFQRLLGVGGGGGGIGETNLLRKAKTTTTKKKLLDVGAQSFAVLEWYSYYGKKSVLDPMIYHKTGVTYHLLRPPGWTS